MSSTFNGTNLFDSGPHRFAEGPSGEYLLANNRLDPTQSGSTPEGPLETTVLITGRLIGADDDGLWSQRDTIAAQLTDPPQTGDLKDHYGRTWSNMSFIQFTPADRTDRGRDVSLAYTAKFVRFLAT